MRGDRAALPGANASQPQPMMLPWQQRRPAPPRGGRSARGKREQRHAEQQHRRLLRATVEQRGRCPAETMAMASHSTPLVALARCRRHRPRRVTPEILAPARGCKAGGRGLAASSGPRVCRASAASVRRQVSSASRNAAACRATPRGPSAGAPRAQCRSAATRAPRRRGRNRDAQAACQEACERPAACDPPTPGEDGSDTDNQGAARRWAARVRI
jgi:hypothetical protein